MGYLYLSVSSPAYTTPPNRPWKIIANPCAVIIPWRALTKTVFWGSSLGAAHFTELESEITQGIICTSFALILLLEIL